jgi:hypothetical protein
LSQKQFKKKILGPSYRKFVRPVIQKYKIKKISNSKIRKFQDNLKDIKLIAFIQIHNEHKKGNLERVLNHLSKFCNDIVIYDDGSTDGSYEIALKYTSNIIRSDVNDFENEIEHKQQLLDLALSLNPDWIVWLDADEVFDRDGELYAIRNLCRYGESKKIDGFSFQEFNLWKSSSEYRVDENWHKLWQIRLWKNNGELRFEKQTGLHKKIHPNGMKKICKSDVKIIHFGFSDKDKIDDKYQMYKKHGQTGWMLERIKDEKNVELKPFSRDWIPLSTLKITVIALIYRSINYLHFVYHSFNKYAEENGKNVEFLFIANDPTDEIVSYLQTNNIPHLIFRNKDPNEHYIKRVYRAWNYGGFNAPGDIIVFVNSDTSFSPFWLNNLSKNLTEKRIITSRVVEPGKLKQAKYAITKNFGTTYSEFDDESFQKFVDVTSKNKIMSGENDFMPCMIYKDIFIKSGGYPIGNRTEKNGNITSGDWIFFYENLKSMGVKHYCIFDSIVYHIQEGEMDSS